MWYGTGSSRRRVLPAALALLAAFVLQLPSGFSQTAPDLQLVGFPGGFLETATTGVVRPRLAQSVLQALLPSRGLFTFPAPYNTSAIRLTNPTDCGGSDCVYSVGYSYYRNINNHVGSDEMLIFLGLDRSRGGGGPTLFRYNKLTDQVTNAGPLFDPASPLSFHSGEGWYFSGTQPTKIYLNSDSRMLRYDVLTHQLETVFDVAPQYGSDKYIWQMHSSDDDRVHSATLRTNPTYEMLGCVVYKEDTRQFSYFPKLGDFDECHVDKSGRWLVILDNVDRLYDVEMRIIDLTTNTERMVWDQDGAAAHLDTGYGYLVGADNWNPLPNAELLWDFTKDPLSGRMVWHTLDWSAAAPNHIAHGNARPGVPAAQQYACGSGASRVDAPWANEIICFPLDGSLRVLVVAPVMTDLNAPGGGDDYTKFPKGNLDVTGQYFIWASNMGGSRLDAFIVKVPSQVLMGGASDTTAPSISITAPTTGSTVGGSITVSASASDNVGVAGVQFRLDGVTLGAEDTASPYAVSWTTTGAANGSHTLTAVARDAAGNSTTAVATPVTVANGDVTPPLISAAQASAVSSTGATVTWTTNESSDSQVEYGQTTGYGTSTPLGTAMTTSHGLSLAGLSPATLCHYRVKSRDAAGNLATSGDFTFTTLQPTPPPPATGPIAYWKLDDGSGTLAADSSGNGFNGTLVNGPAWVAGRIGQGLSFDGVDDYVDVPSAPALDTFPLTLAAWVKTTDTGLHGVVNKYLPASLNGYQVFINGGSLCAWYFRDASNYVWDGTGCTLATPGFTDGAWHHVAFVVDAAGGRLYVDGVQKAARAWTGTAGATSTTAGLSLARYPGSAAPYFPGALDEVRLYNRALSASEVAGLAIIDTTAPIISAVSATNLTSSGATIAWTTSETADTQVEFGPTTAYGVSTPLSATLLTGHSQPLSGLASGTVQHYRVKSRDAAGSLAVSGDFSFTTLAASPAPPGKRKHGRPLSYWKLNDASGTSASDDSGNGFTGALVNGPAWSTGVLGGGLELDGLDDYVEVPHDASLDPYPLSIVLWVRTGATGLHGLVNKYLPGSLNGYQIFINSGNLCAWYFRDASDYVWDGTGCTLMTPGVTDALWHHVALVVDDSGGQLYVDGELQASHEWMGTPGAATTTTNLRFGLYPGVATPFLPGTIDDVRLYARALSADEVAGLYSGAAR